MRHRALHAAPDVSRPSGGASRRRQRGFGLIGIVVAVTVLSLLMGTVATRMLHDMRVRQGEILGQEMTRMNSAVIDFTRRYPEEIKSRALDKKSGGEVRSGLSDQERAAQRALQTSRTCTLSMTNMQGHCIYIDEKEALQDLLSSVAARGVNPLPPVQERRYVIRINITGERCDKTHPGHCAIDSAVYIDQPILRGEDTGTIDDVKLNAALRRLGPGGGMSLRSTPHRITFAAADDDLPAPLRYANPAGNQAGILLIDNLRSVDHLPFLRITGGEISGPIDMTRNHLKNVGTVAAEKIVVGDRKIGQDKPAITIEPGKIAINAANIESMANIGARDISASGAISAKGSLSGSHLKSIGDIHADGAVYAKGNIASEGDITSKGNLSTGGNLILGIASANQTCQPDGALSSGRHAILLQCRSGHWKEIGADAQTIAKEVRLIQRREEGRLEQQTQRVDVGPRYPLQYNYSVGYVDGEWDHCAIDYVDDLFDAKMHFSQGMSRKRWWVRGQAPYAYIREMWGVAYVKCERRIFD